MTTLLMILGGCLVGLIVGLIDRGKPTPKGWKPKKKGFFDSLCEGDVTYPGYTVHHKKNWHQ